MSGLPFPRWSDEYRTDRFLIAIFPAAEGEPVGMVSAWTSEQFVRAYEHAVMDLSGLPPVVIKWVTPSGMVRSTRTVLQENGDVHLRDAETGYLLVASQVVTVVSP